MKTRTTPTLALLLHGTIALLTACSTQEYSGTDWYNSSSTPRGKSGASTQAAGQTTPTVMVAGRLPSPGSYTIGENTNIEMVLRQAGWTPGMDTGYDGVPTVILSRFEGNQEYEWVTRAEYVSDPDWRAFTLKNADVIKFKILAF